MEYTQIERELSTSATLKLLRSDNIAFVISFLYQQFKIDGQISISEIDLEEKLNDYQEHLKEYELGEYPLAAKEYLKLWCDAQFLRKTFNDKDEALFSLTTATEKAIVWLEELQQQDNFIGTESRFLQIFSLLKEIQEGSTTNVETRLTQLKQKRDEIQTQIDQIVKTEIVERYSSTQLQERFVWANRMARQLIADFEEIQKNFRDLTRKIQKAYLDKDSRKGNIIRQVMVAERELKESDQGRSFDAFWRFLTSDSKQQELKTMIQSVYEIEELQSLTKENNLLKRIDRRLSDAGEYILRSNYQLIEILRRTLDEGNLQENRLVAELTKDVKRLALQIAENISTDSEFWTLEGKPDIYLIMSRPLHNLEESEVTTFSLNFTDFPEIELTEESREIEELYEQFYIDEDLLTQRIAQILEHTSSVTLVDLIQRYPVTQGLSEIVSYLAIAARFERHSIDYGIMDEIIVTSRLNLETQLKLTIPKTIFYR